MMLYPIVLHCMIDSSDHYILLGKLLISQAAENKNFSMEEWILLL